MTNLTDEQTDALAFLNRFVEGGERMACLAGYAGVGKTHLVSHWLQRIDRRRRLCVAAPTHQALEVLRDKCVGGNLTFYTLSSLLGEKPEADTETGEDKFVPSDERKDGHFELIVVDECSMVDQRVFNELAASPAKVLFVGDPAQLPPVSDGRESPSFRLPTKFQMTQIVRQQAGNPIIGASLMIRQKMESSGFVLMHDMRTMMGEDRRLTYCAATEVHPLAEDAHRRGMQAPILAFKNETVIMHNFAVHRRLYPDAPLFAPGEPVLSYETRWGDGAPVLYNGEVATCVGCEARDDVRDTVYEVPAYNVLIKAQTGTVLRARVAADDWHLEKLIKKTQRRMARLSRAYDPTEDEMNQLAQTKEMHAYLKGFLRLRHTYSLTVHKSQGSTFNAVIVDWADVSGPRDPKMHYVAVTRAAQWLVVAEPPRPAARGAASPAPRL